MTITTFDTLMYAKKLKEAGCSERLAEVQAEAMREIIENNLATKQDLLTTESNIKRDLKDIEKTLIIKVGGMIAAAVGILSILITLLSRLHY